MPVLIDAGLRAGAQVVPLLTARTTIAAACAWMLVSLRRRAGTVPLRDPWLALGGVVGLGIGPLAGYFAIQRMGPMVYMSLFFLHVPAIAILLPRLGLARPSRAALACALACTAGVVLVSGVVDGAPDSSRLDLTGLGLAAIATSTTVVLALLLHRAGSRVDPTRFHAQAMTAGALILALALALTDGWGTMDGTAIGAGALIAVLAWLPGRLLWGFAVRDAGARTAGIFGSLQPMLVALIAVVMLGDALTFPQWAGVVILTGAVAALQASRPAPEAAA